MLLQTKLHVPVSRRSLVERPQILARLNDGLERRLTLVAAPAGFGKTTLIANWGHQLTEASDWRFAWLSLDESDNDPVHFFHYLVAALEKSSIRVGLPGFDMLQSSRAADKTEVILTALLNALVASAQPVLLALDDYHLITNRAIHESIRFLLDKAPPGLHLALIGRADPPFSLARLRAQNHVTDIRQTDLRFSTPEAAIFLNELMKLELPQAAVTALENRTEGWVAGLQMAALSLQGRPDPEQFIADFTGSHRYIFDFLAEEALAARPEGTRRFLLQTAILDRFCAPLCDAVLEEDGARSILAQLERANLFLVPLDDVRHWYRYHHLFGDLLRHHLGREHPELVPELHDRASRWFEEAGHPGEAVSHALAGRDYSRAAQLVTHYSDSWLIHGDIGTLLESVSRLPSAWQRKHPQLIMNHAWAKFFRSSAEEVEATLRQMPPEVAGSLPYSAFILVLRGALATREGDGERAIELAQLAQAELSALEPNRSTQIMRAATALNQANAHQMRGDTSLAHKFYEEAVVLNREVGNLSALMNAIRGQGTLFVEQGQLHQAEVAFQEAIQIERQWASRLGAEGKQLLAAAPLHVCLGQLYYGWNRLDEAEEQLVDAVERLRLSGPVNESEGLTALALLRLAQGEIHLVPRLLQELETLHQKVSSNFARWRLSAALATTRAALYQHDRSPRLRATIDRSLPELRDKPSAGLAFAQALIALEQPSQAIPLLEQNAAQEATRRPGLWLAAAVLLALAHEHAGNTEVALDWLRRAMSVARPGSYIRLFLDGGPPVQRLLEAAVAANVEAEYATTILAHLDPSSERYASGSGERQRPIEADSQITSLLSPREVEVLQLVAHGLTNKEIAAQLFIAPSTAKRHTINIYNKLGVGNRAEATARAFELGLMT